MSNESPLDLTFGVELEFILGYPKSYISPELRAANLIHDFENDEWAIVATQVYLALKAANIRVTSPDLTLTHLAKQDYSKWRVIDDSSIYILDEIPSTQHQGVEIPSRILAGSTAQSLGESLDEIRQVISVLTTNQPWTISTNVSTGLHVHVGNKTAGFPHRTLTNLAQTLYAFENQIQSIHPDERVNHYDSLFCNPMRTSFPRARDDIDNLIAMQECPTVLALTNTAASGGKTGAYSFSSLRKMGTIEFRQHRGTMDAEEICAWVEVVTGLVQWSHNAPSGVLLPLAVSALATDKRFGLMELLRVIGKEHLVKYYRGRVYERETVKRKGRGGGFKWTW
ncbi:MAG: hypothetical protein Q9187_003786 [Circinaria calcarea]